MAEPLAPGAVIGILGGGQLGRMLAIAAARLGFRTHVFEPGADPPAGHVAAAVTQGEYEDVGLLDAFAGATDVVTYEFENVPVPAVERLAGSVPVFPDADALRVAQDRLTEKDFLSEAGLSVAPYRDVAGAGALGTALAAFGGGILKTRRLGYDGKGQVRLAPGDDAERAMAEIGYAPAILEGVVPFVRELSVIVARGADGTIRTFDPAENIHAEGILRRSRVPGDIGDATAAEARRIGSLIAERLGYVGVLGVELFEGPDGALLVNEIAPRVHNTGHWTIEACLADQFEQHIRAVAGWPLADGSRHSDAEMVNLIGEDADDWATLAARGGGLHLYGKAETRAGRKMGHVTRLLGPATSG